jgi:hypothetical protein
MGFIVHAGHHSIIEVAEVYNRLLDHVALESLEKLGTQSKMTERNMPYYHIGNYASFFNSSYINQIVESKSTSRLKI